MAFLIIWQADYSKPEEKLEMIFVCRYRTGWKLLRTLILAVFFAVSTACAATVSSGTDSAWMPIQLVTVEKGNFSGIVDPLEVVIRTPAEWQNVWKRHVSIQTPPSPVPPIAGGQSLQRDQLKKSAPSRTAIDCRYAFKSF